MWVSKRKIENMEYELNELKLLIREKELEIKKLKKELDNKDSNDLILKAERANKILDKLGIASHTESGKQIRSALSLELLGSEYDMVDKYSKATFIKTQGADVMKEVKQLLLDEGILTRNKK